MGDKQSFEVIEQEDFFGDEGSGEQLLIDIAIVARMQAEIEGKVWRKMEDYAQGDYGFSTEPSTRPSAENALLRAWKQASYAKLYATPLKKLS